MPTLDLGVVELGLELLGLQHLANRLHEVFLHDVVTFGANGKQTRLRAHLTSHIGQTNDTNSAIRMTRFQLEGRCELREV